MTGRLYASFSFIGLVVGAVFVALSVTPSLLPRPYLVQGILSGCAFAVGYGLGVGGVLVYRLFEIPSPGERVQRIGRRAAVLSVAVLFAVFLRQMTYWQNSIRQLMELPQVETSYPYRMALIALLTALALLLTARGMIYCCQLVSRRVRRVLPPRLATLLSFVTVAMVVGSLANDLVLRRALNGADRFFLAADKFADEAEQPPTDPQATGSEASVVRWDTIGRQGKDFLSHGPTREQIATFLGRPAQQPLRVYVGQRSGETAQQRAAMALQELIRVGAFERSLLVVATPTGTGWLDPAAVDTLEYLHAGNTAIVATQYSYLPSWITILVDPRRSIESADALFHAVYQYWKTLDKQTRPRLYLHGLSLGALGGEVSADLYTIFEDPIQGAVWSGPPFPSSQYQQVVAHRNPDSPSWLPTFRDGRLIRFTAQQNHLRSDQPWGPIRTVYISYASDPMTFFSSSLLYRRPEWLAEDRGPDVSPYLRWVPVVTFLQLVSDLPLATSVPAGYGHTYHAQHYLEAWIEVTEPPDWRPEDTPRLVAWLAEQRSAVEQAE